MLEYFDLSPDAVLSIIHHQYPTAKIKSVNDFSHGKQSTMRYFGKPLYCHIIENRNKTIRNRLRQKLISRAISRNPSAHIILL